MTSNSFLRIAAAATMIGALPFAAMAAGATHGDVHRTQIERAANHAIAATHQSGTTATVSQAMPGTYNATPVAPSDGRGQRVEQAGRVNGAMTLSDGHQTAAVAATGDDIDATAPSDGNGQRVGERAGEAKTQS